MKFLKLFLINVICGMTAKCQDLCDNQYENQLIDGLFNVENTLYAFRKPYVWIIQDMTKIMPTKIIPIPLSQLIKGIPMDSIQSGFSINGFSSSDAFNPNGITFVFDGNKYYVSKYKNETAFDAISDPEKKIIPWDAQNSGIMKNVLIIGGSINAAVYDYINKIVYFLTDQSVDIIPLTENRAEPIHSNNDLTQQFVSGNGGIMANDQLLFFAENNVWSYSDQGLLSMNQTYWQFFQCNHKRDNDYISSSITEASGNKAPITTIKIITPIKTSEQEIKSYRKTLINIMSVLLTFIVILAILITIVLYISLKNSEPNKANGDSKNQRIESEDSVNNETIEDPIKDWSK